MEDIFRSRISVLVIGTILATFIFVFIPIFKNKVKLMRWNMYAISGVLLFTVSIFCGTRYIISGDKVYMKIMWVIPNGSANIANIVSVERSYNLLSSPAASLKRLHIRFKKGGWLISPVKEKEFVEALKAVNPDIVVNISEKKGKWRIWDWDI